MKEWLSPREIAALAQGDLPGTERNVNAVARREGWRRLPGKARKAETRGGGWEYHVSLLPGTMQARLMAAHASPANGNTDLVNEARSALWARFESLSSEHKETARTRLAIVDCYETLRKSGLGKTAAVRLAARRNDIAIGTLQSWLGKIADIDRADRLAALAPGYKGAAERADCDERAWAALKSDYLRPERPSFSACYRRMRQAAAKHGWSPVPSERAMRRHLEADVPKATIVLARNGRDKAKTLYPAQRRTRGHLHAMQAVNIDGHKLDLFVRVPGRELPTRVYLIALQDLYSGKFVAWRLSESENKETTRLVIGDMVERYGIPDQMYLDNGRAFASKWITGGVANRYRFKVRDEEPQGLLTTLGVEVHWTTPYSGQSKPIERAFRDFADDICKHPLCAGCYTGNTPDAKPENYGDKAIELKTLSAHIDACIAEHNARPGRRAAHLKQRSFDQAFADSLADPSTIVRWPTAAQRSLWLLAAERIRASKGNGEIRLLDNRYWSEALTAHAGREVTVRFDPDDLTKDIHVYDSQDRLICAARLIGDAEFNNAEAARSHSAKRNRYLRTNRELQRQHAELTADELARLYAHGEPERPKPQRTKVTRIAVAGAMAGGAAAPAASAEPDQWNDEAEESFSRGLRLIASNREDM
ncbi:Mu transposase C-terminal domain-containing protein [Hoeflea sp. WL0058]|uniref:Mu transposase C-terminal domain-containing protein n=1 Tax=Flavimaribacter sediminis TaxID=2865987 RepID=A0AAE3D2D1_9HYPH|nr:transposase domain-containing protein [Flavimaribacter sediminis]MBW8638962.1 Mu transposase C-terminal domain-containing protein [Flavimaribacter sediminis]